MNRLRIILLCVLAACGYGIAHDQITVRVCAEYLSVAHPPLFPTRSPTLLALCWGVAATWFVGLAFGAVLATVAHAGSLPPEPAARLRRPVLALLTVMGLSALAAGVAGYGLTRAGLLPVPVAVGRMVPDGKQARFMAVWFAHLTSYLVGIGGGTFVCFRLWKTRGRPRALALLPRGRAAWTRAAAILMVGAAVWWWRFR
ncbi:MAG: hypothetical protein INR65_13845 [Gluconacetobacter diazotrophicus]|nr:hypothetical protein [Gluconacetobacter diazotrophicus]